MEKPNLRYIKELSDGDLSFEKKLISLLKHELPIEFEEFLKNFEERNFIKTAGNVHKLKHKISILGLTKAYEEASRYENDLRERQETKHHNSFVKTIEGMLAFLTPL
ncbi:MAG: Hpt domain-containing protein [Flavobacteriaceae bacterium]|nr:Hpt domain-containing protein [Flavobacteriaceae bacterium]